MLFSYNWIKELIPELKDSPESLAELLTLHAFETTIHNRRDIDPRVAVVKIERLESHPNADRLRLATVYDGSQSLKVVCGAQNISEGDVVPYAPPGTKVIDESGHLFEIKSATIRGVESPGMLTSPRELGLGDSHAGIFILPKDTQLGTRLCDHIPPDTTLSADITANRAHDCLSHWGIAREVAALLDLTVQLPPLIPLPVVSSSDGWTAKIESRDDVWRYMGIAFKGLKVALSPLWLQSRLMSAGLRPINNIVDITNYVMLEVGNPVHAFDYDRLSGKTIGVRRALAGEELETLDGVNRTMNEHNLVITCEEKAVAIAGVMGGASSEVSSNTTSVFLESASFHSYTIQESARQMKIHTESSSRFAKEISPELAGISAMRATQLLQDIAGGQPTAVIDYYPRPVSRQPINFLPERVSRLAGVTIPPEQSREILVRLRCDVDESVSTWQVTPPVDRLDLIAEHDLIEEVIRVFGLNKIDVKPLTVSKPLPLPESVQWRETIRNLLVDKGFTEDYNYSFEDESIWRLLEAQPPDDRIKLLNPPSPDQRFLRSHLLPRLLATVLNNKAQLRRKFTELEKSFFEIGSTFQQGSTGRVSGVIEEEHVAGVVVGSLASPDYLRQIIDSIVELYDVSGIDWIESSDSDIWRQSYVLTVSGEELGRVGMLSPATILAGKIGQRVAMLEINPSILQKHSGVNPDYTPLSPETAAQYLEPGKYPPTFRDISIVLSADTSVGAVEAVIERLGGGLVERVDLFDEYQGPDDTKSLAFHIMYQSRDHTLTNEEVAEVHNKIVTTLKEELGAHIK